MNSWNGIFVVLSVLLGGCSTLLALPYSASDSEPVADLAPYLPAHSLAGATEVLVLTQHSAERRKGGPFSSVPEFNTWLKTTTIQARLLKGSGLAELERDLKLSSEERIDVVSLLPATGSSGIRPLATTSREKLEKLCLVTEDGWEMTFLPRKGAWDAGPRVRYDASRRDAVVAALRTDKGNPFSAIEAPCAIAGDVAWPNNLRSRLIEFLAKPPKESGLGLFQ